MHVAWSGDHVHAAERLPEGAGAAAGVLVGGELLRRREVRLAAGDSYATPGVCFTRSDTGMDGASTRVHRWLRARPHHPPLPRPLVLNTWEAVDHDHDRDLDRLRELADIAARIGVERFVLDDGWFVGRRHDRAGLGDWTVDTAVWPAGLGPLVQLHVRARHEVSAQPAGIAAPSWWDSVELTGSVLADVGLQLPLLHPGEDVLLHLTSI